uniref:Uncharacterized protein n=1 Tax=Helianthus annuus TaxID=4232 RepID=A0A251RWK3_HELAN
MEIQTYKRNKLTAKTSVTTKEEDDIVYQSFELHPKTKNNKPEAKHGLCLPGMGPCPTKYSMKKTTNRYRQGSRAVVNSYICKSWIVEQI